MDVMNFAQVDFLSTDLSKAISRVSSEILKPLTKDLRYDDSDIDLLFDTTRDKISAFLSKNAFVFVSLLYKKGMLSTNMIPENILDQDK
jgi:hypothetical protein